MESRQKPMRHEVLTWSDVDMLVDTLLPQIRALGSLDAMLIITRGGIVPGGMLAEALDMRMLFMAAVDFPAELKSAKLMAWPKFTQFPESDLLRGKRILTIDDVWGSGRTSTAVRGRVEAAGGQALMCVFHFNPYRSLFTNSKPSVYGAVTDSYIIYPWELDRDVDSSATRAQIYN